MATRIPWWQNIRWRLALGSMLVALLSAGLLGLTAIVVINYYYGNEQQASLSSLAHDKAQSVGILYTHRQSLTSTTASPGATAKSINRSSAPIFLQSVREAMNTPATESGEGPEHLYLFFNTQRKLVYPIGIARGSAFAAINSVLNASGNAHLNNSQDQVKLRLAIINALQGQPSSGLLGQQTPVTTALPFLVEPIFASGDNGSPDQVIGVVMVTPFSTSIPAFVMTVGLAVLIATPIIAILVAAGAILYARTITRPLAKLTAASRLLASGDYDASVSTDGPGELGELAHTFNEMAAQLKLDVNELRRQEIWRRELIMNVTHDLATPLTAIAGLGEALVDGVNQSYEDYEATGRIIVRETLRLRRLVQDLHVMAKVEAGALLPQLKPVRLAALVDEIFAVVATEFESQQVEPVNTISYSFPVVQADTDMFTRVFTNLFNNSLHYTPSGGQIIVDAQVQGDRIVVSVTDTGDGIPEESLARIFDRFYRADNARQSNIGGSGLGLAIVQAIIEAHHGTVWAENVPEVGARISFTLPLQLDTQSLPTQPLMQMRS
jgi:signal transduction histidine kinase